MKTIIHVNQHHIKYNVKNTDQRPVFTVKQGKKNTYADRVKIHGPSEIVYSAKKPLSCGARAWIETESEVECINPTTYKALHDK